MSEWKTIDTAPRDGSQILLFLDPPIDTNEMIGWCPGRHIEQVVGWWTGQWACGVQEDGFADSERQSFPSNMTIWPTHWAPLPAPPAEGVG